MRYSYLIIFPDTHVPASPALAESSEKLVVTPAEIGSVVHLPDGSLSSPTRRPIPIWAIAVSVVAALCLPLLCVLALVLRIAHRRSDSKVSNAWNSLLCTLLIASGLATTMAFALIVTLLPRSARPNFTAVQALDLPQLPLFPAASPLNPEQIASEGNSSVFILTPEAGQGPGDADLSTAPIGAATLLMATPNGFLMATNRHVVEAKGLFQFGSKQGRMVVFSHAGGRTIAEVVGVNRDVDLALVWAPRKAAAGTFYQPIAGGNSIRSGEPVFVIGHPQRLFYTLSSGLVSRASDADIVQFSAPVSPGNSGGPVYDSLGELLGIVAAMVDRGQNPNAENLNFAVRSDKLLSDAGWDYQGQGRAEVELFRRSIAAHRFHD